MKKSIYFFSIIFVLVFGIYSFAEARAGGGGSNGGGSIIGGAALVLIIAIYKIRREKLIKKAKLDLEKALSKDSSWDLKLLEPVVKNVFYKYQQARMDKNLDGVKDLITKNYFKKADKIMNAELFGKKNILKNINILELNLVGVKDIFGKEGDMFAMEIRASMIDYTVNETTGEFISSTNKRYENESYKYYKYRVMSTSSEFTEYYIFIRHNKKWLLNNIKSQFSIVGDIIKLNETQLKKVLEEEKKSDYVDDSMLYTDD